MWSRSISAWRTACQAATPSELGVVELPAEGFVRMGSRGRAGCHIDPRIVQWRLNRSSLHCRTRMTNKTPTPQPTRIAALRALADPVRLALVDELAAGGRVCVRVAQDARPVGAAALAPPEGAARGRSHLAARRSGGGSRSGLTARRSTDVAGSLRRREPRGVSALALRTRTAQRAASAVAARRRRGRLARALQGAASVLGLAALQRLRDPAGAALV